ncbi:sigma-54 dependent transcriptional regulator [Desulfobacterales bacterium HSG16]|nr:sigma-54 dependent transcriptional regulator [Desulfobacterales bacterium HSG16]
MGKILIIDDDEVFSRTMGILAGQMGHEIVEAFDMKQGAEIARSDDFDVVLLDVDLPDGCGLDLLPGLKKNLSNPEVIIMTGAGNPDGAEIAIKTGAWDYIEKTASIKKMTLPLSRAMRYREEKMSARKITTISLKRESIIGDGPVMKVCLDMLAQASDSMANVLITGETGTGKDLFSHAIHENSKRSDKPFVVVDCASLPENLVESVLFGHEKGAFTGAEKMQNGLIKQADRGTLFLDEIGELPITIQKSFLRVIQERRFRHVGGRTEIVSDFRLISATNQDLDAMVQEGTFRKDLLYRINSLPIKMPALREYFEDMKKIALYYISIFCNRYNCGAKGISNEFFDTLKAYPWPGNVRELINAIEHAVTCAKYAHTLLPIHLPINIRVYSARSAIKRQGQEDFAQVEKDSESDNIESFRITMEKAEKEYFEQLISLTRGNIKEVCRISGLSRSRVYSILKKHGIGRKA